VQCAAPLGRSKQRSDKAIAVGNPDKLGAMVKRIPHGRQLSRISALSAWRVPKWVASRTEFRFAHELANLRPVFSIEFLTAKLFDGCVFRMRGPRLQGVR
jgi:hypothetical protein